MKKTIFIVIVAVLAFVLMCVFFVYGSKNHAIVLEEQVKDSMSDIEVAQKARYDKFINLADAIKSYDKHESETLEKVINARGKNMSDKDAEDIKAQINVVAEKYPELQAADLYKTFMTEVALTENKLAEVRGSYNNSIKLYSRYVRKFPTDLFLNMTNYEVQDFKYIDYTDEQAPVDAPKNLFDGK